MTKNFKSLLSLAISAVVISSLMTTALPSIVHAGAVSAGATVKPRVNNAVSMGESLRPNVKGAKVFVITSGDTLRVLDENSASPTAGSLLGLEITSGVAGNSCFLNVYDSALASDTTLGLSQGRVLTPELYSVTSQSVSREFMYPKQFHRGLVAILTGGNAGECQAFIDWTPNGGSN